MGCVFCKIIKGDIPARKAFEDELVIVIEDLNPVAPVHLLIIPKKHIVNCCDLGESDTSLTGHIFNVAAKLAADKGIAESGFRLVNNNNAAAGQSVFHIHFHLLGGRQMGWPPG